MRPPGSPGVKRPGWMRQERVHITEKNHGFESECFFRQPEYGPNLFGGMLYSKIAPFCSGCPRTPLMMKNSLLLTGLVQRLLLAAAVLMLMWGVYFWAAAGAVA